LADEAGMNKRMTTQNRQQSTAFNVKRMSMNNHDYIEIN